MKDYIEALREIKKENKDFKITLSRKEVLELVNEFDRLNNIINGIEKILKECMDHYDYLYDKFEEKELLDTYYNYKYVFDKLQKLKGDSSNE